MNGALLLLLAVVLLGGGSALAGVSMGRVRNRGNAAGVHPSLQALLDEWERYGSHDVMIPSSPWGGLRTSEAQQAGYAQGGMSDATTLASTPHGRGAAIDVWPVEFPLYVSGTWAAVPDAVKAKFAAFGDFAEARGFTWGGRWRSASMPNGDQPHVEIKNWRAMPYPPPNGRYA